MYWTFKIRGTTVRRISAGKPDQEWLKRFGAHVDGLIRKKGYKSVYDFWINRAGESFSRAALNYIVSGRSDPKATTLRELAKLLDVKMSHLLEFDK